MRFERLVFHAWGHFDERELVFSPQHRVHLVYGKNEAGKSTTRRGIGAFLFGIDHRTDDAHTHKELRIGATVTSDDGARHVFVRRKGLKNTLLRADGSAADEAELRSLLAGVSKEVFGLTFSLDHVTLRAGGEALASGRGEVGASLFQASLGGRKVHEVQKSLLDEAEKLFVPKGQKPPLNAALKGWNEAKAKVRELEMMPETVLAQEASLREQEERRLAKEAEVRALDVELARLRRVKRTAPMLREWESLAASAEGPDDPAISDAAVDDLRAAQTERRAAEERIRELTTQTVLLSAERATLAVDEAVLKRKNEIVALELLLARYREDRDRRAQRSTELEALRTTQTKLRRDLGAEAVADPGLLREARTLGDELEALRAAKEEISRNRDVNVERLGKVPADPPPSPVDVAALEAALARFEREEQGPARRALQARLQKARDRRDQRLQQAGPPGTTVTRALSPGLPSRERVERCEREIAEARAAEDRLRSRLTEQRERALAAARARTRFQAAFAVPSDEELAQARRERDAVAAQATKESRAELSRVIAAADRIADDMRRESGRIAERARLVDEEHAAQESADLLAAELTALELRRKEAEAALAELLRGAGVDSVEALRLREAACADVARAEEEIAALDEEHGRLEDAFARARASLVAALPPSSRGDATDASEDARRVEAGRTLLRDEREHERLRAAHAARRQALEEQVADDERKLLRHEQQWRTVDARFRELVPQLGLPATALPLEAASAVRRLTELSTLESRLLPLEREFDDTSARIGDFERQVEDLSTALSAAGGPATPAEARLALLRARLDDALGAHEKQRAVDAKLLQARAALDEAKLVQKGASDRAETLVRRTGKVDEDAAATELLRLRKTRSDRARRLDLDGALRNVGDGVSLADLQHDVRKAEESSVDLDQLLRDAEARVEDANEELDRIKTQLRSLRLGLDNLRVPQAKATEQAEEAESLLARVEELAHGYAVKKLSAVLLAKEFERYRQAYQAPILDRASRFFETLTGGSFSRIVVGWDDKDEITLRCVRPSGQEVGTTGLSEGTRDQLYLGLRMAALSVQAGNATLPLPLVLDDVLVHFDDDRAAAALRLFGELAPTVEIVYLTHHARIRDLAATVLGTGGLDLLEL